VLHDFLDQSVFQLRMKGTQDGAALAPRSANMEYEVWIGKRKSAYDVSLGRIIRTGS
jgi:hypothetical protein